MKIKIVLFINLIVNSLCYTQPIIKTIPLFRFWNCIGFKNNIDDNKPFQFKVGDIPLVAWKSSNNTYLSTLNICKHFGSTLHEGKIEDGCLKCPYHGYKHSINDKCGVIIEKDNKLWWSYNPIDKTPQSIPYIGDDFVSDYIEIEMNEELPSCMYNSMDINHAEYIHSGILGFGSDIPIKNYEYFKKNNVISTSFVHYSKNNIKLINKQNPVNVNTYTSNYHEYIYPSTSCSVVCHGKDKKIVIGVSMTPVDTFKTKWFITVSSNYMKDVISKNILTLATKMILNQDKEQFDRQSKNTILRNNFILKKELNYEDHIKYMRNLFENYNYPKLQEFIDYHKENPE